MKAFVMLKTDDRISNPSTPYERITNPLEPQVIKSCFYWCPVKLFHHLLHPPNHRYLEQNVVGIDLEMPDTNEI